MEPPSAMTLQLRQAERELLARLRLSRRAARKEELINPTPMEDRLTSGQRIADRVAAVMGSWTFIILQSVILLIWIILNITAFVERWDPYPFILLNLALSFQAAYAAPVIMMSQNRQQEIDRKSAESDHSINIKAELEIELLHQKIDDIRDKQIAQLTEAVRALTAALQAGKPASA